MFEKFNFTSRQIKNYYNSALRDYKISLESEIPEVIFRFCYDSLLKFAIALCAQNGLRVKAHKGHHVELLKKMSDILKDEDVLLWGSEMRSKRNLDLYGGGVLISHKDAKEYLIWMKQVLDKVEIYFAKTDKLF